MECRHAVIIITMQSPLVGENDEDSLDRQLDPENYLAGVLIGCSNPMTARLEHPITTPAR